MLPEPDGLAIAKLRATHIMSNRFWEELGFGYVRHHSGEGHPPERGRLPQRHPAGAGPRARVHTEGEVDIVTEVPPWEAARVEASAHATLVTIKPCRSAHQAGPGHSGLGRPTHGAAPRLCVWASSGRGGAVPSWLPSRSCGPSWWPPRTRCARRASPTAWTVFVYDEALVLSPCAPEGIYAVNGHVDLTPHRSTFELAEASVGAAHWSRR